MTRRVRVAMPAPENSRFGTTAADHWVGQETTLTLYGTPIGNARVTGVLCASNGSALLLDIELDITADTL